MWAPRRTHARPLPTGPPDTLLTHSSIWRVLENTGALEQRHVDVTEWVGGGWVGGLAEPEDGAAEAAERRSSMGVRRVGGRCSRGGGDVAVLHRELDGRARVRRVLLRAGEVREECLPGSRSCRLASSLRDGPRDCQRARVLLDHVHAHGLERRVLRGGGLLGRHESCVLRFARRAVHTLFARTAGVNVSRVPQRPGTGVDMWRVPRYRTSV